MKKILFFFSFISLLTYGQKEHYQWFFGGKAALDFSTGVPLAIHTSTMTSFEGCVSYADTSGNLLFYSNGGSVWNKNHLLMDNGTGLMGDQSTTQSCFVVKKPGSSSSLYYLFTLGHVGTGSLGYSIIDMSLAAGLGSVTTKNYTLATNMTEKLHGTLHCNGTDVWVVGHKYNSNAFHAYLLSATGVNTVAVISAVGYLYAAVNGTLNTSWGAMKFSPSGKKISIVIGNSQLVELSDFDPASGQVSNPEVISTTFAPYGCEFSPDGSKLYVSTSFTNPSRELHQWDLCAGTASAIINSHQLIAGLTSSVNNIYGAVQLGPDGKIYGAYFSAPFISVINNPNASGNACNFVEQGPSLSNYPYPNASSQGLPNHMSSWHRPKAQINTAVSGSCGAVTFSYSAPMLCSQVSESITSIQWRFNDPLAGASNTSSVNSPQHFYSQNGTYTVSLLVHHACYTDTLKQVVSVSDFPNLIVSGKPSICNGEATTFSLSGATSYSLNGSSSQNLFTVQPSSNTSYTISATGNGPSACIAKKTVSISVSPCTSLSTINHENNEILIYPNPTSGFVTIEVNTITEITVSDISGRVVSIKTLNPGKQSIDLSDKANGIYFIKSKNSLFTFKVVKE